MDTSLPLFLTKENKIVSGLIMFGTAIALYLVANHFHLSSPQLLPMSWVDEQVPFLPNTVWIYISEYVFFTVIYLLSKDMVNLNKYLYSFLSLQVVSVLIFWAWPTTYPRDQFPLPTDLNALTTYAFSTLRQADSPASCCPSLHVSSVFLSAFLFLDEQKKKLPFFLVWGILIAASTLTTKQHYLVDVFAGLAMSGVTYYVFHRWISYKPFALGSKLQANR